MLQYWRDCNYLARRLGLAGRCRLCEAIYLAVVSFRLGSQPAWSSKALRWDGFPAVVGVGEGARIAPGLVGLGWVGLDLWRKEREVGQ